MVDRMMSGIYGLVAVAVRQIMVGLCLLYAAESIAEDLTDPTRPPASIAAPVAVSGQGAINAPPSGLHSIIISKARRAAIVDGQTIELGGMHNGAKLVEVNEGSVVFQGAQGRRVMTLFPDVKMTNQDMKMHAQLSASKAGYSKHKSKARSGKHHGKPAVHKEER